ncbi:MAG TPA: carboxypeptidase M32 [Fimbriimonadaceae bacterium]|nr:carboxypeptidase M32 [Fimbriimonadaceae bacterium]
MSALATLKTRLADFDALNAAGAMMDWDMQTYMPPGGAPARAEHSGILARMAHEVFTSDSTQNALSKAAGEVAPGTVEEALVRVVRREMDLRTKIPASFVEKKMKAAAHSQENWVKSRAANDFASFQPSLTEMFDLARQEAEYLGYKHHIYNALLDQYDEGSTKTDVDRLFGGLRTAGVQLIKDITNSGVKVDDSALYGEWDKAHQSAFTENIVKAIGFDFNRGRQDTAAHPFCTNWSVGDVRLTTRYKPFIGSAIFGSLHEAGHGMYEQGSPMEWDRTPLAGGVSLGIHESQSRFWENIIGRSRGFWSKYLPELQALFPKLASVGLDDWYQMINKVEPSLIRVEADEVTYNMHIMVRFELECAILTGELLVKDLPEAWNAKYEEYLGITPDSDANGCMQDIHWAAGLIGYFPTYTMGNCLSYQFWNVLKQDVANTDALIAEGNFEPILTWLQEKIYRQGKRYQPKDLVLSVTGKPMGSEDYIAGIRAKYAELYRL